MNLFFPRVIFCLNNHATILIISKILVKNLWHGFTSIFFFPSDFFGNASVLAYLLCKHSRLVPREFSHDPVVIAAPSLLPVVPPQKRAVKERPHLRGREDDKNTLWVWSSSGVRRYFRHTFIEKNLNGRVCGRVACGRDHIYILRVCPEHTQVVWSYECVLCLFNAWRKRNISSFV